MSDPGRKRESWHDNIWLLLPWYANGTLEAAERLQVEDHLTACAGCREELERCNDLASALRAGQESAPSPHPIQLARLMARVEASERGLDEGPRDTATASPEAPATPALIATAAIGAAGDDGALPAAGRLAGSSIPSRPSRRRIASLFAATPRPVRFAMVGQLAALLLVALALTVGPRLPLRPGHANQPARTGPSETGADSRTLFHVLSAPAASAEPSAGAPRPQIRVLFADAATEKQIREVLLRVRGRLVDGPSPLGTYTLEIPAPAASAEIGAAAGATGADTGGAAADRPFGRGARSLEGPPDSLGIVLGYLRSQAIVRFAEPVAGVPAAPSAP